MTNGPERSNEKWVLSYGWHPQHRVEDFSKRPGHVEAVVFHSLEAALNYPGLGTWQEIRDPTGAVVLVTGKEFIREACPNPSLCAKQLLNKRFPGMFPEAEMDAVLDSSDVVSYDDGETWSRVLLGVGSNNAKPAVKATVSASRLENLSFALGPKQDTVEIRYEAGRAVVRKSALVIRQNKAKSGKSPSFPSYDLAIRRPGEKRVKVYASNIEPSVVEAGRAIGITIEEPEPTRADGLPRGWKPGLFQIAWKEEGEPDRTKEVRGFIRGSLAIDRRMVDLKGWGDSTWKALRWCLTHIPSGSGIVMCKARKNVEEIADRLREVILELTDGDAEVSEKIKTKARAVLEEFGIKTTRAETRSPDTTSAERERIFGMSEVEEMPAHITGSTPPTGPVIDPERRFYVSVVDGENRLRYGFLIGPFKLHQTALSLVDDVSRLTQQRYPWSHFYSFGTCSMPKESAWKIPGVLNDQEGFREIYFRGFLSENGAETV